MILAITPVYAALLGILFLILRTLVTIERAKSGISILTADNMILAEKVRRFGNFIETAPFILILMGLAELNGASAAILHSIGGFLLISRLLHPLGLDHKRGAHPLRIAAGLATMAALLIAVIYIFWNSFV